MSADAQAMLALAGVERRLELNDWLKWQETLHSRPMELGLERCRAVAERLRFEQPEYTVISVAGTNGKGSSVAMLNAVLRAAGYRVGTYTSPHLLRYNERIRIDDRAASDAELCDAFQRIDSLRGDTTLTYFEFGTLAALDLFARAELEVGILEVGLGGRLDAVNLVDADLALITSIDLDHTEWLGPDRSSIAREKIGIFRPGGLAVCADPAPPPVIAEVAAQLGTELYQIGRDFSVSANAGGWTWNFGRESRFGFELSKLRGAYQSQNAAGALMALQALRERLPIDELAVQDGLRAVELPGRFQIIRGEPEVVLDVAHNDQAAACLAQNLREHPSSGRTHVIIGMLKEKDHAAVLARLSSVAASWHVVDLDSDRATPAEHLRAELERLGTPLPVSCHADPATAYRHVRKQLARKVDRILVCGSFLTVAAVARALESLHPREFGSAASP